MNNPHPYILLICYLPLNVFKTLKWTSSGQSASANSFRNAWWKLFLWYDNILPMNMHKILYMAKRPHFLWSSVTGHCAGAFTSSAILLIELLMPLKWQQHQRQFQLIKISLCSLLACWWAQLTEGLHQMPVTVVLYFSGHFFFNCKDLFVGRSHIFTLNALCYSQKSTLDFLNLKQRGRQDRMSDVIPVPFAVLPSLLIYGIVAPL